MGFYYPNPTTHPWSDLVVGGSAGNPIIALLDEENELDNGYFKDVIANWGGGTVSRVEKEWAMRGSYVMGVQYGSYAHQAFSGLLSTYTSVAFTGFIRLDDTDIDTAKLRIYTSASTARVSSPSEYFDLDIDVSVAGASHQEWIPFYMIVDTDDWTGSYLHIEIQSGSGSSGSIYVDDLRLHKVEELISMECPQTLRLKWQRKVDAEYELLNGDRKTFLKGWRPVYSIGYDYCSREELIKHTKISESMFALFVPQDDGLMRAYVRMVNDFDSRYFKNKFIGHTQPVELQSIFLQRYKNRQYGGQYFSSTYVDV